MQNLRMHVYSWAEWYHLPKVVFNEGRSNKIISYFGIKYKDYSIINGHRDTNNLIFLSSEYRVRFLNFHNPCRFLAFFLGGGRFEYFFRDFRKF